MTKPLKLHVPLKAWMRFLKFVRTCENDNGCWLWSGCHDPKGYSQFWYDGRVWRAHRFAWMAMNGPIPTGDTIDHECHNRGCVCPGHVSPLDRSTNTANGNRDRGKKYVFVRGMWLEEAPF